MLYPLSYGRAGYFKHYEECLVKDGATAQVLIDTTVAQSAAHTSVSSISTSCLIDRSSVVMT